MLINYMLNVITITFKMVTSCLTIQYIRKQFSDAEISNLR